MNTDRLSARHLAKHGLRRGAYDGARKRRFVIFEKAEHNGEQVERRYEYDTKRARDAVCIAILGRKENEAVS